MKEHSLKAGEKQGNYASGYIYGAEKHYGIKYDQNTKRRFK